MDSEGCRSGERESPALTGGAFGIYLERERSERAVLRIAAGVAPDVRLGRVELDAGENARSRRYHIAGKLGDDKPGDGAHRVGDGVEDRWIRGFSELSP
jgi:hypothetical protein